MGSEDENTSASADDHPNDEGKSEIERYSTAHVKFPADDLEFNVHDTQVSFLQNLSAVAEDSACSEQLRKAFKDSEEGFWQHHH